MIKARGFVLTFLCLTCLLVIKSQIVSPNLCTKNINLRILVAMEKIATIGGTGVIARGNGMHLRDGKGNLLLCH